MKFYNGKNVFNTDQFLFDKKKKSFSQDASTLGIPPGKVFDKLGIVSQWTNRKVKFTLKKKIQSGAGTNIIGWEYENREVGHTINVWNT
ncbi:MAG: hypothetical protein P9L97_05835 [Candidatus Tenebribacter davisii]|nr:hypothetical protein [Candidatus Tenebribacter davisii]